MSEGKLIALLAGVGAFIGIGQLLASQDPITIRVALGRAIISGGLGLCAGTALVVFKDLPLPALVGIAATFTSLGTSAIERVFKHYFGGNSNGR
jgi:hypothetical protein